MWRTSIALLASAAFLPRALGGNILHTDGFTDCNNGTSTVKVNNLDISFDKSTNQITFDVSGTSAEEQKVTAELLITAYGVKVYSDTFDPCAEDTKVDQLCPGMYSLPFASPKLTTLQYQKAHFLPLALKAFPHPLRARFPG